MNTIFTIDQKDYSEEMPLTERYAVRALICKNGLWAMQKSAAGDYKIPGGGVEEGESYEEALIREVREETGLLVIPDSIREIGEVLEIRRDSFEKDKKYINNILALVIPDRNQKIKCTICSYNDKLNITINSNIEDFIFQKTFYKLLQDEIKDVNIESNNLE